MAEAEAVQEMPKGPVQEALAEELPREIMAEDIAQEVTLVVVAAVAAVNAVIDNGNGNDSNYPDFILQPSVCCRPLKRLSRRDR